MPRAYPRAKRGWLHVVLPPLTLDVLLPSSVYPITEAVSVLFKESTHSAESVVLPPHPFPVMLPLSSWGQNPLSTSVLVYWNQLSYIGTSSRILEPALSKSGPNPPPRQWLLQMEYTASQCDHLDRASMKGSQNVCLLVNSLQKKS